MWGWWQWNSSDSTQRPWRWREPAQSAVRCPKCSARIPIDPVEDRCPYCGYVKYKSLDLAERDVSILPSLREQIEEDIAEAEDPHIKVGPKFVGFETPASLLSEKWAMQALLFFGACLLFFGSTLDTHYVPLSTAGYVFAGILTPGVFQLFNLYTTLLPVKLLAIALGIALAATGIAGIILPQAHALLDGISDQVGYGLFGFQAILGLWMSSYAWREHRLLLDGRQ